ncbi:MAG: hypothetical protein MI739_04080 [Bacteroidales bacterium]|nr:hypothetical protein [Bacteroidales bacterium]
MAKYLYYLLLIVLISTAWGCKDEITDTYTANSPIYMNYETLRNSIEIKNAENLENTGKILYHHHFIFINEYFKGIHIIDNSNPSKPQIVKFISIPGNTDISIDNKILYADSFIDLVSFDISDINNIELINRMKNIFQYSLPPCNNDYQVSEIDKSKGVVIDWELKEVTSKAEQERYVIYSEKENNTIDEYSSGTSINATGSLSYNIGGSSSRFVISQKTLYAISYYSLNIVNITNPRNIRLIRKTNINWDIESIFPYDNKLFISSKNGMVIYDLSNKENPRYISDYWHISSCDPIVFNRNHAYVSIHSGNLCNETNNQIDIIDISKSSSLVQLKSYPMQKPLGIGINCNKLFVCDAEAGLLIFDITNILDITNNKIAEYNSIKAYNIIPIDNIIILIDKNSIKQYDCTNPTNLKLLSSIPINN